MLKHCHHHPRTPVSAASSCMSNSLSSLEYSASSGSEVSFDASFGSSQPPTTVLAAQSPVPTSHPLMMGPSHTNRGSLTPSEPTSMSSSSSSTASGSSPGRASIKVYASCLRPDIEYKTLSVSHETRSRELIWQLLGKFKMKHRDPKLFYLTMDVVISRGAGPPVTRTLVLDEDSRPAELASCNPWGECRFSLQMRKGGLVRVHDSVLVTESQYKSLLISEETTVEDVVRILLHCNGMERLYPVSRFCLYEHCKSQAYERKLNYEDRPLAVQDSWLDPDQFRLVLRRTPPCVLPPPPPARGGVRRPLLPPTAMATAGSIHQVGLPNVPVHSHAITDMGARAMQADLMERYSRFCQRYESYFYV